MTKHWTVHFLIGIMWIELLYLANTGDVSTLTRCIVWIALLPFIVVYFVGGPMYLNRLKLTHPNGIKISVATCIMFWALFPFAILAMMTKAQQ